MFCAAGSNVTVTNLTLNNCTFQGPAGATATAAHDGPLHHGERVSHEPKTDIVIAAPPSPGLHGHVEVDDPDVVMVPAGGVSESEPEPDAPPSPMAQSVSDSLSVSDGVAWIPFRQRKLTGRKVYTRIAGPATAGHLSIALPNGPFARDGRHPPVKHVTPCCLRQ